jgi:hypothetical protein
MVGEAAACAAGETASVKEEQRSVATMGFIALKLKDAAVADLEEPLE